MHPTNLLELQSFESPPVPPKVLFIDLDGTVVNSKGIIDSRCKEQLQRAQAMGVHVAIATGRPYFAAQKIIEELQISAPSMFFSGSLIVDPSTQDIHFQKPLLPGHADLVLDYCAAENLYCEIYTRSGYFISEHSELTDIHKQYLHLSATVGDPRGLQEEILKAVIVIDRSKNAHHDIAPLIERQPELHFASGYGAGHPHIEFVNVTSAEASREHCFKEFLRIYNVESTDTMAIGDAEADIPFISLAGTGIAMGNAPDAVKMAANYTTRVVDEQGLAYALQKLIPQSA
jgi:Cof subfamily protein (haloacid dehalogenase superfamily)